MSGTHSLQRISKNVKTVRFVCGCGHVDLFNTIRSYTNYVCPFCKFSSIIIISCRDLNDFRERERERERRSTLGIPKIIMKV